MNNATQNLEDDHLHILKLIDAMELMTQRNEPTISHLEEAVGLIQQFADGLHHAKEESLLFPLMAQRGFSATQGPIAVMLHEHTQGRAYVQEMTENILRLKAGDLSALNLVYNNMLGYSELLRNHISKENNILFRMADNALSEEEQQTLVRQFEKIEIQDSTHTKRDFLIRIEQLTRQY